VPKVVRWKFKKEEGHNISRDPFTPEQQQRIQQILADSGASVPKRGWATVNTNDDGIVAIYVKYLTESAEFIALNILIDELTPEVSRVIHRLMKECSLMAFPMSFAVTSEVARMLDCDWPRVEMVATADRLHELLARGPYHSWNKE